MTATADTEWTVPTDFETYTDENKTFSISYPYDWEVDLSIMPELEILNKQMLNDIDPQSEMFDDVHMVFYAGVPCGTACYHPICTMSIESLGDINSIQELNAYQMMSLKSFVEDYEEVSHETTIIDGRESIIIEFEATYEFNGPPMRMHMLNFNTYKGNMSWSLSCGLVPDIADYVDYEDDFYNVVRSLQLHY